MDKIKKIDVNSYKWLAKILVSMWFRHQFDPLTKSDHTKNNMTESFNYWIGQLRGKQARSDFNWSTYEENHGENTQKVLWRSCLGEQHFYKCFKKTEFRKCKTNRYSLVSSSEIEFVILTILNYNIILTNWCSLRKIISLVNHIKFVNYF